jgi:hypothetical protein
MKAAIRAFTEHRDAFEAFDYNLRLVRPDEVNQWANDESRWAMDRSAPNPYESEEKGMFHVGSRFRY